MRRAENHKESIWKMLLQHLYTQLLMHTDIFITRFKYFDSRKIMTE
jgi:hypothetical protein